MKKIQYFTIKQAQESKVEYIIDFVMKMRKELFPMLRHDILTPDLLRFDQYYILNKHAAFFIATSEEGKILGSIGICPYDGRFNRSQGFNYHTETAEIVKCYIDSNVRRLGIGTALSKAATSFSHEVGYKNLYLHTHPFLLGGIPFWKSQGYVVIGTENDPIWETLHMVKDVSKSQLVSINNIK